MSHGGELALDATLKLCSRDRHLKYKKPDPGKELEKKETFDKSKTTTGDQSRKRTPRFAMIGSGAICPRRGRYGTFGISPPLSTP